jgi:Zn-dependent protease/CBS domain-containing protein
MKWSIKLGRLLGIDVYIHVTFLLLLVFIGLVYGMSGGSFAAALTGVLFFVLLFLCVLLHEFGHALTARRYGIPTKDITLLPIGGVARLERMPEKPAQEFWVALAGPAVNVVIALLLAIWMRATGHLAAGNPLAPQDGGLVGKLLTANLFLVLFNLLPAFPMDGGRVLRALLAMRMPYARATGIAAGIGQAMALLFGLVGLFGQPMLLFIALFVWIGAAEEAAAAEMKSTLHGFRVRDAMQTEFHVLSPRDTLGEAVRLLLSGSQHDFPVVEAGRPVGLLLRSDLVTGLRERGEVALVDDVMLRDLESADPAEALETAFQRVKPERGAAIPVLDQGRLVGLLTAENVGEFVMVRSAVSARPGLGVPPPLPRNRME